jgi:hypothetical protein
MGIRQSYAEYLKDWRHLLAILDGDPTLASIKAKAGLEAVVARVDGLTKRQAELQAEKQTASVELKAAIVEGLDLARDVKSVVKGELGSRSESLVKFKLSPLRQGRRSKPAAPEVASKGAANGGQQPGVTPSAAGPAANGAPSPSKG